MTSRTEEPILDAVIRFDNLPATGRSLQVVADEDQRAALARLMKVTSVEAFSAELTAMPLRGGIRVRGHLEAKIIQPCVVTFEPVVQDIDEPVDRLFLPGVEKPKGGAGSEVFVDLEDDDLPDYVEGPEVDLSPMLTEALALSIDPYPRAPDAEIPAVAEPEVLESSPFSKLAALKPPSQ